MKKLTYAFATLLLSVLFFEACNKTGLTSPNTREIVATKTTIVVNKLDSLAVTNISSTDSILWTVSPTGSNTYYSRSGNAVLSFTKAGTYIVSASVNGAAPLTLTITATAAPVNPADTVTNHSGLLPLTGDQISLTPHYQQGPVTDSVSVWFTGTTINTYACSNSELKFNYSLDASNHFVINFANVQQFATCTAGPSTIPTRSPITFLQRFGSQYIVNGTYPLTIKLNGTTYTGSVIITTTTVTINWTYTAGITITPLVITR